MSKQPNVLDAMRALPRTGAGHVLRTLVAADVQRQVANVPGLSDEERRALLEEALSAPEVQEFLTGAPPADDVVPTIHAAFGLGAPAANINRE